MTNLSVFEAMAREGALELPLPGRGHTAERHMRLFDIARRHPVSVARLVEAHTDAVAILSEAERDPTPDAIYGVWASNSPTTGVHVRPTRSERDVSTSGDSVISGSMPFASGLGCVTRALITGTALKGSDEAVLVDIDARPCDTIVVTTDNWATPALADSNTGSINFHDHPTSTADVVGPPGWYLGRVGFWHGACGPAACWAGAAAGLIDAAVHLVDDNAHRRAHLGAMRSHLWALEAVLRQAGTDIDRQPADTHEAQHRARALRHHVERTVADILDRFGRAFGPRPFALDTDLNQRWLDTHLYTRQDHAERDLEALGHLTRTNCDDD